MAGRQNGLRDEVDNLNETLDGIGDLADEALDPELSREQVVAKVKEIADIASGEEGEEEPGEEE